MPKLSAVMVRNVRHDPAKGAKPIRIGDGGGLYLQVAPGDAKSWIFRFTLSSRERWMGLGSAEHVSLAEARALAAEARRHVAAGRDPIEERERACRAAAKPSATFEAAARALVADVSLPRDRAQIRDRRARWSPPRLPAGATPSMPGNGSPRWNATPSR